jgi:hypothetical protein
MKFEDITPETLELRLKSTEHDFVERKSRTDKGGWIETAVAFANSAPIGWPAVLFVGADDDGNPQLAKDDLEDVIRSVSAVLDRAFPAIYRYPIPLDLAIGSCVAVIIPGSALRPHFAGPSFIRAGTETKRASDQQFGELIAQWNAKAREILQWKGKAATLETVKNRGTHLLQTYTGGVTIADCNAFFVTLRSGTAAGDVRSLPLEWIELSFDDQRQQLKIIIEE